MIQTTTKSQKSNVPAESEQTSLPYQIPRYPVHNRSNFPVRLSLYLAGCLAVVLIGTELALYLSPDISRSYALLLTVVCSTSAVVGEYVSRLQRRAVKGGAK